MVSNAISGVGTVFNRADGNSSDPSFTAVAEVNSISGPNVTRDTIDVTSLDSTSGYREFIGGFRDGGELSLEMNFTLDGYDDLKADLDSDVLHDYQIELQDTGQTTFEITGLVTNITLAIPMDDKVTATVTIKISGPITVST
jgi:predicted secreted protein